jgi:alpha-glucosidase (family GH31 glycosyl hydrolase)
MKENYDLTLTKDWHPDRFFIPAHAQQWPETFLMTAKRIGFHVSMWMCCDYDLLYEAERRAVSSGQDVERQGKKQFHPDAAEQDEHFTSDVLMDKITDPKEPWFNHLMKFVDQGISAFKLDGAFCVCEHPDRLWGAGLDVQMTDEQMHNLYPIIYNQQMTVGYSEHTHGLRPLVYTAGGGTGIQQFSATWSGDTGGGTGPLVSLMNHGLSGHSNTTVDMDIFSPAGIHFGFLQPWSQLCSWAYWRHPWYLGDELGPVFTFYTRLRSRLIPYIYSMAHVAANTGMPILRAMPLVFPDDPTSDSQLRQYMLGDAFLVGAFEESFHLPAGKWIDFWTGERYDGEQDFEYQKPAQRGGPLFLREGAIVPLGPAMDYWGQRPLDEIELHVFPAEHSQFVLTEDDGETLDYREGKVSETTHTCMQSGAKVLLEIKRSKSTFADIPQVRNYSIIIYLDRAPVKVVINGEETSATKWDGERKALLVQWNQTAEVNTLSLQITLS